MIFITQLSIDFCRFSQNFSSIAMVNFRDDTFLYAVGMMYCM